MATPRIPMGIFGRVGSRYGAGAMAQNILTTLFIVGGVVLAGIALLDYVAYTGFVVSLIGS